ncbi:MAG: hypothetical protein IID44_19430 [Planctomycetes bacterium]|nr:hypothetical protein [Planctomycetota bacterium]
MPRFNLVPPGRRNLRGAKKPVVEMALGGGLLRIPEGGSWDTWTAWRRSFNLAAPLA